ncbi:MAG: hypothetical protein ACXU8U_05790 [Asticcacaulis sp.]
MTRDASHQSLDINIGRIIELYIDGDITADVAREDLIRFFHGKKVAEQSDNVRTYISNVLDMLQSGELEPVQARNGLVRAAAAAEKGDPAFAGLIKTQAGASRFKK